MTLTYLLHCQIHRAIVFLSYATVCRPIHLQSDTQLPLPLLTIQITTNSQHRVTKALRYHEMYFLYMKLNTNCKAVNAYSPEELSSDSCGTCVLVPKVCKMQNMTEDNEHQLVETVSIF